MCNKNFFGQNYLTQDNNPTNDLPQPDMTQNKRKESEGCERKALTQSENTWRERNGSGVERDDVNVVGEE